MFGNKHLDFLSGMDGCIVPNHYDRARDCLQQISQEFNHLFARHAPRVQLDPQVDPPGFRRDQQRADQIGPLMMVEAGSQGGRLTARGPSPFEGTDWRFATFIKENKGCAQGLPLFLSTASGNVSNKQFQPRLVAEINAVVFGNAT